MTNGQSLGINIFVFILFLIGCRQNTNNTTKEASQELSEFEIFYNHFQTDSLFQINHISFPLEGKKGSWSDTTAISQTVWLKAEWKIHKPFDESSSFSSKIIKMNDDLYVEYIVDKDGRYGMERRFAKVSRRWYLIYYSGLRHIK